MRYLTEDLIDEIKDITKAPPNISETSIIRALNRAMLIKMVPLVKSVRQNFFLTTKRVAVTANKSRYTIPARAIGGALSAIWFVDANGERKYSLSRALLSDLNNDVTQGDPRQVVFLGDEILTFPVPDQSTGYLEFWFEKQPNELVATSECAKITGVSSAGGTTTFTVDTDLTESLSVGDLVDFPSGVSPYLLWADDVAITAITATTIEVATDDVADELGAAEPVVGDYISAARTTNIPSVAEVLHPVLCHQAAVSILQAIGDLQKLTAVRDTLKEIEADSLKLLEDRLKSEPEVVNPANGVSSSMSVIGSIGF